MIVMGLDSRVATEPAAGAGGTEAQANDTACGTFHVEVAKDILFVTDAPNNNTLPDDVSVTVTSLLGLVARDIFNVAVPMKSYALLGGKSATTFQYENAIRFLT